MPRPVGYKHSAETRAKIAAAWTPEKREAARVRGIAFADDPAWRSRVGRAGEANPNYQGKNGVQYGPGFTRGMKKRLLDTRGRRCERCGKSECWLDVHHIDCAKTNHAWDNLTVLCRSCHRIIHPGR